MTNIQMKDSGIEWLGAIPKHWEVKRIKDLISLKGGGADKKINDGEKIVKLLNFVDVYKGKRLDNEFPYMQVSCPEHKISQIGLRKNDLLITPSSETRDDIGVANIVVEDLDNTVFSYHILRMRLKDKMNSANYLKYLLNSKQQRFQYSEKATGTTRVTLSRDDILTNILHLPTKSEQTAIANYLDHHTAKIDGEIDYLEKKATLLEEFKQSLIFETVTKGLDKSAPMKDSGLEWIGEIPEHWVVKRIKDLCRVNTGSTPDRKQENYFSNSEGLPWIKPEDLNSRNITTPSEFITKEGLKFIKKYPARSLIISGIGNIGKIGITNFESTTNQQNHILHSLNKMSEIYLYYYLTASNNELKNTSKGNVLSILNASKLKNFLTLYPNLSEQKQIADYLDKECGIIDTKVNQYRKKAKLLKEYKQSLIYEAVTGKIEIPKEFS